VEKLTIIIWFRIPVIDVDLDLHTWI